MSLCSHRRLSFDPSDFDHIFVSRSRRLSPCEVHSLVIPGNDVANLCHCLQFPSLLEFLEFLDTLGVLERQVSLYLQILQDSSGVLGLLLSRQVSLYLRPAMHLCAIIENSTLRRDWNSLRQISQNLTNLFDKVL